MGDIHRRLDICGLTPDAERLKCVRDVETLVDQGATKSVISSALAERVGGRHLINVFIEGRAVPTKLVGLKLHAPSCREQPVVVAVDDKLVARAGRGPSGNPIEIILGHDYLEAEKAALRYKDRRGHQILCDAGPLKAKRKAKRK